MSTHLLDEAVVDAASGILVPIDDPDSTDGQVDAALDIARRTGATVHALYVVETESSMGQFDLVVERREAAGEAAVERVEKRGATLDVPVRKAFRYGTPHEEIHGYAADHEIDLIVLGSREQSLAQRLFAPTSTLERVVRGSDVPVLVATDRRQTATPDPAQASGSANP